MLNLVFRILATAISVYGLLVFMRVLIGWVVPQVYGRPWDLLCRVVDPYLALFRRIRILRRGVRDYSVLLALAVLWVASSLLSVLGENGRITLGLILAVILSVLWGYVRFLAILFIIFGILRLIPILFRGIGGYAIWKVADLIVYPVVSRVTRLFRLGPRSGYTQHLILTVGLLFVIWILGELVVGQLMTFFLRLPV